MSYACVLVILLSVHTFMLDEEKGDRSAFKIELAPLAFPI